MAGTSPPGHGNSAEGKPGTRRKWDSSGRTPGKVGIVKGADLTDALESIVCGLE
jgi:hypothetical protein